MGRTAGWLLPLFVLILLTGCNGPGMRQLQVATASLTNNTPPSSVTCAAPRRPALFSASPLCQSFTIGSTTIDAFNAKDNRRAKDFIGALLDDSMNKCQGFIDAFTGAQSGENLGLDIASIALSALATVFVPVNTVRALSAASTITQGTKAAINSDMFQQLTVQLFVQQINATYFKEYTDYVKNFRDSSDLTPSIELAKIQAFHKDCSIPFAAANITSAQAKETATHTSIGASQIVDKASFKGNSGIVYTVAVKNSTYTLTEKLPVGSALPPIATTPQQIVDLLNTDQAVPLGN